MVAIPERQVEVEAVWQQYIGVPDPSQLTQQTASVSRSDEEVFALALASKHGDLFRSLYEGDTSHYDGDDSRADLALCNKLALWTGGDQHQIDRIFRSSGLNRPKWDERRGMQTYGEITIQKAIETSSFLSYQSAPTTNGHSNDPLPPLSVHSNLSSADFPQSDAGNAELFAALYGNRLRYDHRQRLWLKFAGHWWEHDRDEGVIRLALEAARYRQHLALQVQDADQKRRVMKWALEAESQGRLNAMLAIAKALPQFADSGENWDRDDWLLGVANGVVDLRTGAPRNGVPDDLITKHSPVSYDPNAQDDLWDEFRRATFVSPEVEQFVQTLAGIGACGSTIQRIGMAYGPTGTGKTTLMGGLQSVLGS